MQLAIRTNHISALIIGGFPPINGPYKEMLQVTMATREMSISNQGKGNTSEKPQTSNDHDWTNVEVTINEAQVKQFVTLYQNLQDFDDREAQSKINCCLTNIHLKLNTRVNSETRVG